MKKTLLALMGLLERINNEFNQAIILTTHNPGVAKLGHVRYDLKDGILKQMN